MGKGYLVIFQRKLFKNQDQQENTLHSDAVFFNCSHKYIKHYRHFVFRASVLTKGASPLTSMPGSPPTLLNLWLWDIMLLSHFRMGKGSWTALKRCDNFGKWAMWAAVSINTGTGRLAKHLTTTSRGSLVSHTEGSATQEGWTITSKVLRAVGLCRPCPDFRDCTTGPRCHS